MNTLKNKLKENERTRRRDLLRLLSLDADFPDESNLPEELVAAQPEPQEEYGNREGRKYLRRRNINF